MLTFQKKYSTNIQKNATHFGLSFIPLMVGWSCIMTYGFPTLAAQPINEKLLGKSVPLVLLWVFLGLVLYFLAAFLLSKKGYISYPSSQIAGEEIESYNHKYQGNFSAPKINAKYYLQMLLSLFIPAGIVIGGHLIYPDLNQSNTQLMLGIGAILMFFGFYGAVRKIMRGNENTMIEVIKHANEHIPETNIKLPKQDFDASKRVQVSFNLDIEGLFKGRNFSLDYSTSGTSFGRGVYTQIKGGLNMASKKLGKMNFSIAEKMDTMTKFKGNSLDECFEKRFKVKGIKIEQLPDSWKQKLLESFRAIDLKVKDGMMNQGLTHTYFMPFYSTQGIFLFLDFMLELEEDFENKI